MKRRQPITPLTQRQRKTKKRIRAITQKAISIVLSIQVYIFGSQFNFAFTYLAQMTLVAVLYKSSISQLLQAKNYLFIPPLDDPNFIILLQSQSTLATQQMHFSSDHNLKLFKIAFLFVAFIERRASALYGKNFKQKQSLLQYPYEIGSVPLSNFYNFWNKVDNLLADDRDLIFLLIAVPPRQFDPQADLFVNLRLTAQDTPGALQTLLHVFTKLLKRISQGLMVLLYYRQNIFQVQFTQQLSLQGLNAFGEHIQSQRLKLVVFATFVDSRFVSSLYH